MDKGTEALIVPCKRYRALHASCSDIPESYFGTLVFIGYGTFYAIRAFGVTAPETQRAQGIWQPRNGIVAKESCRLRDSIWVLS